MPVSPSTTPVGWCLTLADLGVSHLYLAPILTAVLGSMHGYDVLDHTTINPELGGRPRRPARHHRGRPRPQHRIDIVPNHMALVAPQWRNAPLWNVLRDGRQSLFAAWFDVDWNHLDGRFGLPILGDLADELGLGFAHPRCRTTRRGPAVGQPAALLRPRASADPRRPHLGRPGRGAGRPALLLASHTEAADVLNYRRFFEVDQLVAVRVELPTSSTPVMRCCSTCTTPA